MIYDARYFYQKFEAIPEEMWCTGLLINSRNQMCAFGHCGNRPDKPPTQEALALGDLMGDWTLVLINDNQDTDFPQPTPKQRILAALKHYHPGCDGRGA